jgi:hypothetical protein
MTKRKLISAIFITLLSFAFGVFGVCILFGAVEVSLRTAAGFAFLAFSLGLAADVRLDLRPLADD